MKIRETELSSRGLLQRRDGLKTACEQYTKSVLGEGHYALACSFFESVFHAPARYKVFLRRRCLNLMYLYLELHWDGMNEEQWLDIISTFYSDSALLADAKEIAQQYCILRLMPSILIVDDILIHGRTLNRLIDKLTDLVYQYVREGNGDADRETVARDLLGALNIRVMVQNGNPLLLRSPYVKRLYCAEDKSDIWSPHRWHELSARLSRLMGEGYFQNTSYVLSVYDVEEGKNGDEGETLSAKGVEHLAESCGFTIDRWARRNRRDVAVRTLTNDAGDHMAFYTLRITQNSVDGKYSIVPFFFCSNMGNVDALLGNVSTYLDKNGLHQTKKIFDHWRNSSRTIVEILYLIFSHNILLLLQQKSGQDWNLAERLDVDKIKISFRSRMHPETTQFLEQLAGVKEPFFSWEEMNRMLLEATKHAVPLVPHQWIAPDSEAKPGFSAQTYIDLVLSQRAEMRELDAFYQFTGQEEVRDVEHFPEVERLYATIRQLRGDGYLGTNGEIIQLIAETHRLMDLAYMSVHAEKREREGEEYFVCTYHEGEQSQFIQIRRFADYLPILVSMERDCSSRPSLIKERVVQFYKDKSHEELTSICDFVDMLYRSGQRLRDWSIGTLQWAEIDTLHQNQQSREDQLLKEMALRTAQRLRELERYRTEFQ